MIVRLCFVLLFMALLSVVAMDTLAEVPERPNAKTYELLLSWDPPTQRESGTDLALTEIKGYEIYFTPTEGDTFSREVDASNTTLALTLVPGEYSISMRTVDTDGLYSVLSESVSVLVPPNLEDPPSKTNIEVEIQIILKVNEKLL